MSAKNKAATSPAATLHSYHGSLRQAIGRSVSTGNNRIYIITTLNLQTQITPNVC